MNRCTGHCCRRFWLPYSPSELKRAEAARVAGSPTWTNDADEEKGFMMELDVIASMVVPLEPAVSVDGGRPGHYYTCKNLRPDGNCGIYESRPKMCSDYPYGRRCNYAGCTWDKAKRPAGADGSDVHNAVESEEVAHGRDDGGGAGGGARAGAHAVAGQP